MPSQTGALDFQIDSHAEQVTHHWFDFYFVWWAGCLTPLLSEFLVFCAVSSSVTVRR